MKLRIYASSLRFRITQQEAEQLRLGQIVASSVQFAPASIFRFALSPYENTDATFLNNEIIVYISAADCDRLEHDEQGLSFTVNNEQLRVVIEKDVGCSKHPSTTSCSAQ